MGPGLPKVTPSHGKDQWPLGPAAASPFCLNFLLNSGVCLVKNANPTTPFSYNHTADESHVCPQPCNTSWVRAKGLNTFLYPPPVPGRTYFPSWWRHIKGSYPNIVMFFQTSYLVSLKPVSLQQSAYLLTLNGLVVLPGYCHIRPFTPVSL